MKIYYTQAEVEKDIKNGVLAIEGNVTFACDIAIDASIFVYNGDITAGNITAGNITARDITAGNIDAADITAWNIAAINISYYASCLAYDSIECTSIKALRGVHREPICLDGKLTITSEVKKDTIIIGGKTYEVREIK